MRSILENRDKWRDFDREYVVLPFLVRSFHSWLNVSFNVSPRYTVLASSFFVSPASSVTMPFTRYTWFHVKSAISLARHPNLQAKATNGFKYGGKAVCSAKYSLSSKKPFRTSFSLIIGIYGTLTVRQSMDHPASWED